VVLALLVLRELDVVAVHVVHGPKLTVVRADDRHMLLDLALVEHAVLLLLDLVSGGQPADEASDAAALYRLVVAESVPAAIRANDQERHALCISMTVNDLLKGDKTMPKGKHLQGVGRKEQKMYEHIRDEAKKDDRYGKRAEEVAARTVLKHHREEHHEKGE
jgi:hypothetical protein